MLESWGRYPKVAQQVCELHWLPDSLKQCQPYRCVLPYGKGRSYGDSCLNAGGTLLWTRGLNHFISFDREQGILRAEAGVSLEEILQIIVPANWFLPVSPGTKFVTLGGAIANDIHGKNHQHAGTFGQHVRRFALLRSPGEKIECSPQEKPQLFQATVGGLGLTGLILWAEIQLKPIHNPYIDMQALRFANLHDFFRLSAESDQNYEYTVAWMDCLARGAASGRGIFFRGNHNPNPALREKQLPRQRSLAVPCSAPQWLLNPFALKSFNSLYYHFSLRRAREKRVHYDGFFYPLDSIQHWNRFYGKQGFFQYQCVLPGQENRHQVAQLLQEIACSRQGSFLAVVKIFGEQKSPGMISFPRPGVTLALDFPNRGSKTLQLMERLDEIVRNCGGAVYPAKDARMSANSFQAFFPRWQEFAQYIDPGFSSSFWRRVTS